MTVVIFNKMLCFSINCFHSDPKVVYKFGGGEGAIFLDNIQCFGKETSLLQCAHNGIVVHNCGHYEDAGVSCGNFSLYCDISSVG